MRIILNERCLDIRELESNQTTSIAHIYLDGNICRDSNRYKSLKKNKLYSASLLPTAILPIQS